MLILVFGGSGSGKSRFAEQLASEEQSMERWYIATMNSDGSPETTERIRRHRQQRQGKGFHTLEWSCGLQNRFPQWVEQHPEPASVLLEDLGNLVANEVFSPGRLLQSYEEEMETVRKLLVLPVRNMSEAGHRIVVVCDMMDEDSGIDTPEMKQFDRWMQTAQQELAAEADGIAEVVAGIPNWIRKPTKGQERNQCSDH